MKKKYFLSVLLTLCVFASKAQTVKWELMPQGFTSLEYLGNGMFEAQTEQGKKLINSKGKAIITKDYERNGGFYEDVAVVSDADNHLVGFLTSTGKFTPVEGNYTLIKGMDFVSCEMLPALNAEKLCGYVNCDGSTLGFDGRWKRVTPFSEGYAVVKPAGKEFALIDKEGNPCQFNLGGVGSVYGGTNVFNGRAIIWDRNSNCYFFEPQYSKVTKMEDKLVKVDLDYLGCVQLFSKRSKEVPYQQIGKQKNSIQVISANGKFGYSENSKVLLPAQFNKAEEFFDQLAIVTTSNHKIGIIKVDMQAGVFNFSVPSERFIFSAKKTPECSFSITSIPAGYDLDGLQVSVKDARQQEIKSTTNGKNISFNYKPTGSFKADTETEEVFNVEISANQLLLCQDTITVHFKKAPLSPLTCSISVSATTANSKDLIPVSATIHNPNDESVTTSVTMKGSSCLIAKTETMEIPAESSRSVSTSFKVKKTETNQYVVVSTNKGGSARKDFKEFKPFY